MEEWTWQQTLLNQQIRGVKYFVKYLWDYIWSFQWAYICCVFGQWRELINFLSSIENNWSFDNSAEIMYVN